MSREVEGLQWPEGDPEGLRAMATHASGLAGELEARQGFIQGINPMGWIGAGRDEFAVSLAEHSGALTTGARAMHTASAALFTLATTVEDAQDQVLGAARKLKAARDDARTAQERAQTARAAADSDGLKLLTEPLSTPGNPIETPSETAARQAENAAAQAQTHALDVERWAQGQATKANEDVTKGDRVCARAIESAGLVQAPGSPALVCAAPAAASPLNTLGSLVLGSGASTGGTLAALLAAPPPPPPPPPPKPAKKQHSLLKGLAAGGLAIVTTGLVVVDALQLGLDPVTDGATVVVGGETAALGSEAIAGEVVAGEVAETAVTAEGLTVVETEAEVIAAEGAPAEGLAVEEGAVDAPVRPSWQQSEADVTGPLKEQGYREQVSFKDGQEVKYGTKGSSRPEAYKPGESVEVKNYDVQTSAGRSRLVKNISDQVKQRVTNLPQGTTQTVRIDVRGQDVTPAQLDELASRIASRSGGGIDMGDIQFIR